MTKPSKHAIECVRELAGDPCFDDWLEKDTDEIIVQQYLDAATAEDKARIASLEEEVRFLNRVRTDLQRRLAGKNGLGLREIAEKCGIDLYKCRGDMFPYAEGDQG